MDFPDTPFQADISAGAIAYSPDGARNWGEVPSSLRENVTIVGFLGDKAKVGSPAWSNGKAWTVETKYVTPITETPPTAEKNLVYIVEYFDDLSIVVLDNQGNILWQSQSVG